MNDNYSLSKEYNDMMEDDTDDSFIFVYAIACTGLIMFFLGMGVGFLIKQLTANREQEVFLVSPGL